MNTTNWRMALLAGFTLLCTAGSVFAGPDGPAEAAAAAKTSETAAEELDPALQQLQQDLAGLKLRSDRPRYQIRKGDVLDLKFPFLPDFNQTVTVLPDGYITLRGLQDLWVEGKTVPEVTKALQSAYSGILKDPVIAVELTDFEKPYFIASGEVGKPGKYDLRGGTTVAEAVAIAGGFTDKAKHSQVLLFRSVSDDWVEVKNLNVKMMLAKGDLSEDIDLRPGDMLVVPKNKISKIKDFIPKLSLGIRMTPY